MSFGELLVIAIGLSADAFAAAICTGLSLKEVTSKKQLIVGLYFGVFQGGMPIIGFFLASLWASQLEAFDHWIAFVLLTIIGGKMIYECLTDHYCKDRECPIDYCTDRDCPKKKEEQKNSLAVKKLLPLAIVTSIDALAVGVSFYFLSVNIAQASMTIGLTTLILSFIGVKVGFIFGRKFKSSAEMIGGIILILMGLKILLEHLGIIAF